MSVRVHVKREDVGYRIALDVGNKANCFGAVFVDRSVRIAIDLQQQHVAAHVSDCECRIVRVRAHRHRRDVKLVAQFAVDRLDHARIEWRFTLQKRVIDDVLSEQ